MTTQMHSYIMRYTQPSPQMHFGCECVHVGSACALELQHVAGLAYALTDLRTRLCTNCSAAVQWTDWE